MKGRVVDSDKGYSYIEYDDGSTNIEGLRVKVNEELRELLTNTGGLVRNLFEQLEDESIYEIDIFYIESPVKGQLLGIYFKGEDDYENRLTDSGQFKKYLKNKFDDEEIKYETFNTLEELKKHPEYDLDIFLDRYDNPTSVNGTGIFIKGKEEVLYKDVLLVEGKEESKRLIEKMVELNNNLEPLKKVEAQKIEIEVKEPTPFGVDVWIEFYKEEGKKLTSEEFEWVKDKGSFPSKEDMKKKRDEIEYEEVSYRAFDYNKRIDRLERNGRLSETRKREEYNRQNETIDYEVDYVVDSEYSIMTSYLFLRDLIEEDMKIIKQQ